MEQAVQRAVEWIKTHLTRFRKIPKKKRSWQRQFPMMELAVWQQQIPDVYWRRMV